MTTVSPHTLKLSAKHLAINQYCTNHLFSFVFKSVTKVSNIQISNHFFEKKNTIKDRITTLSSYYYKINKNNKYRQGNMNISVDITIKANIKQNY